MLIPLIVMTLYSFSLRRRINGLDDERLWLSRKERREFARKKIERSQEEEYNRFLQAQYNEMMYGTPPKEFYNQKKER